MSDQLYTGPTLLEPGASDRGDRVARKVFLPLIALLLGVFAVFYVFFSLTVVEGESMQPALLDDDRLLTTKSYTEPRRGDIVVFRTVDSQDRREDLIKRVVAVAGDSVSVTGGIATINGVTEKTSSVTTSADDRSFVPPTTIEPGKVFVLGDNRPIALDSRHIGAIPLSTIKGKAVFLLAPLNRMGIVR